MKSDLLAKIETAKNAVNEVHAAFMRVPAAETLAQNICSDIRNMLGSLGIHASYFPDDKPKLPREPDSDGWIEVREGDYAEGETPEFPDGCSVEFRHKNGVNQKTNTPLEYRYNHIGEFGDITHYRIIPAPPALRGDELIDREWCEYWLVKHGPNGGWDYWFSLSGEDGFMFWLCTDSDKDSIHFRVGERGNTKFITCDPSKDFVIKFAKAAGIDLEANRKAREAAKC